MPEISAETYRLEIGNLTRNLPIIRMSENLSIASFVMLGDTQLIETCAREISGHPDFPGGALDLLVCPEAKAIPLTHAIARILGINYIVARKTTKAYMADPLSVSLKSITTAGEQTLVLDGKDAASLRGSRVGIIDDVVSTGGSLRALRQLLESTGCRIACQAAVLLEEGGYSGEDLVYLARLPVFTD